MRLLLRHAFLLSVQRKVVDDADSSDYEVTNEEAEQPDDDADFSDEEAPAAKSDKRAQRTRKPSARKVRDGDNAASSAHGTRHGHCQLSKLHCSLLLTLTSLARLKYCTRKYVCDFANPVVMQRKAAKGVTASDYEVTDEKAELVEADELDEDLLEEGGTFRLGQQDEEFHDFSALKLKDDAHNRHADAGHPCNRCAWGDVPATDQVYK